MYSTHVYYATHCPGWGGGGEGGRNLKRKGNKNKEQQRGHQMQRRGGRRERGKEGEGEGRRGERKEMGKEGEGEGRRGGRKEMGKEGKGVHTAQYTLVTLHQFKTFRIFLWS
jgi:hypothetical protein